MPAEVRLLAAENTLSENKVDDVHQENPRIDKDISGNSESDIALSIGPGYAQDKGSDSCHAEPE